MTIIAIDGTFASGKGTLGKRLAAHYGLNYLDTGKLYRAVALELISQKGETDNISHIMAAFSRIDTDQLDNSALKGADIAATASQIAVHTQLRDALLSYQRDIAAKGAVLDGRDIGTVICPHADVKLYIDADPDIRAARRHKELVALGEDITFATVRAQLHERDMRDKTRKTAPLKPAQDAHLLDTSNLSIGCAFETAHRLIDAIMAAKSA